MCQSKGDASAPARSKDAPQRCCVLIHTAAERWSGLLTAAEVLLTRVAALDCLLEEKQQVGGWRRG